MRHWILHEAGIALLEIALIAALAVSLARWTWVALTPGAAAATAAPEQLQARPSTPVVQRHLFGVAITAAAPVADAGGLTLLGVFSDRRPGAGRAILARQGGKPVSLVAGESIAEGLVLREVYPDHVIVLRDGAPQRVELERRASVGAPPPVARLPVRK